MRGRIRTIKPEIHLDEDLWELETRMTLPIFRAYVGLWSYADREGRFEWRPRRLQAVILPYWGGDFGAIMDALADSGFLVKYQIGGRSYGLVRTFARHQIVNNREDQSTLPGPEDDACSTREPRVNDACTTPDVTREARPVRAVGHAGRDAASGEGKGREGNGSEGNGSTQSARGDAPACVRTRDLGPSAGELQTRFRGLYLGRYGSEPYMGGGESVRTFADRLRGTAREKNIDPLELLGQCFERWAAKPLDEIAQNAPYASFAARFGSLCEPKGSHGSTELERLQSDQLDALQSGDTDRYRSLVAEEKRRRGGKA